MISFPVAPLVGAWIEIADGIVVVNWQRLSHPSWVRGLKYNITTNQLSILRVAPLVGAWIEISGCSNLRI